MITSHTYAQRCVQAIHAYLHAQRATLVGLVILAVLTYALRRLGTLPADTQSYVEGLSLGLIAGNALHVLLVKPVFTAVTSVDRLD